MHNFFMQLYFLVCMFKQMLLKHQIKCTCFLMKIAALNFIDKILASNDNCFVSKCSKAVYSQAKSLISYFKL